MRIPKKSIKIGAFEWKIKTVKDIKKAYNRNNPKKQQLPKDEDLWGFCDPESHVIYLVHNMNEQRRAEIFLHECIHAIEESYGISLPEKSVCTLSLAIIQVLNTNNIDLRIRR